MRSKFSLSIYKFGFIFCFLLNTSCGSNESFSKKSETGTTILLAKESEDQRGYKRKRNTKDAQREHAKNIQVQNDIEPLPKKAKQIKTIKVAIVQPSEQAIVLLHGLNRLSYDFDKMKQRLQQRFPGATIIALQSVSKDSRQNGPLYFAPSMALPIREQAKLAYEEIKSVVGHGKHLVIVGHSQGGLRGFTLIKQHCNHLKNEVGITVKKLITIGTPWQGAPIMDHLNDPNGAIKKLGKMKTTLNKIREGFSKDVTKHVLKTSLAENFPFLFKHLGNDLMNKKTPGAADLKPGSDFMRNYVAKGLVQVKIPIRAIAGVLMDFSQLFHPFPSHINQNEFKKLNCAYSELIGGDPNCEHDMLLPVRTQHAEGLSKHDFKCIKVYGTCHGNKVGLSVKKGLSELNNEQVIQKVIALIEETFYEEKQIEEEVINEGGNLIDAA
jgi:pimeloyl-ACP methyl ester carboxylesterase